MAESQEKGGAAPLEQVPDPRYERPSGSEKRMSFMGHLMELRRRLWVAILALCATTVLAFVFFEEIMGFLRAPMDQVNQKFLTDPSYQDMVKANGWDPREAVFQFLSRNPLGTMMIMMKTSLWAGLVLSSPVILFELWSFVAPGLTDREKKALRPIFWVGVFFFLLGAFFCYFLVFPFTIEFLVWLDVLLAIKPWYTPDDTIGLLLTFMLLFGAIFELPLVAAVLARLGFLRIPLLLRFWRYILVLCFFLGGILSPGGDVVSMLIMSFTLVLLYGLSLLLVWFCQRKAQTQPE